MGFSTLLIYRAALDGFFKCFDEQLVIEWLAQEGYRTCLQRPFTYTRLVVGSDEDDRERIFTADQELLNLQAVHSGHLYIKHDTVRAKRRHRLDMLNKLVTGCEGVGVHSQGAQQPTYSATDGDIVIHNSDSRLAFAHDSRKPNRGARPKLIDSLALSEI